MNNGIFPKWVIIWHAALFAIIFSFVSLSFKKNGAIKGPTAPINIDVKPPTMPTEKKLKSFGIFLMNYYLQKQEKFGQIILNHLMRQKI